MEPVLPQPHVVVVGTSPAVSTLASLILALEWRVTVVGDAANPSDAIEYRVLEQWDEIGVDEFTPVIVATQGHYDEPALEAALRSEAPYIGLVASARRAQAIVGYLKDRGFTQGAIDRIETPAGLDLGAIEHREIAVAILARLVELRAQGAIEGASQASGPPAEAIDPVCGMTVDIATAKFSTEHDGEMIYFCCPACKNQFDNEPAAFIG